VFATLVVSIGSASADTIRVQSTTDTVDAGLVDGLLRPAYAAAQPGDTLDYVAVGTGAALNNARAGLADVVITHAPSLEKQFSDQGFSLEGPGRAIFYSDYVIVGPLADPAGVSANAAHDAVTALEDIAVAGDAAKASFVSRGDNSGTNVQEQLMWGLTSTPPVVKQIASNAGTATDRFEPGTGGKIPTWYVKTNQGQAASLQTAAACNDAPAPAYPNGNCYTMVDRGTFNKLVNAGTITNMKIVSQQNTPEARGGRDLLINPFSAYIVNPDKMAELGLKIPNVEGARRFVDFLVSPGFQNAVDAFPTTTDPAFRQDAFPSVALTQPIPATASAGATIAVTVHLANRQPGAPVVTNMPVQLQQSTDNGQTYTNVGPAALTDAIGDVAFAPVVRSTTRFRISTSVFAATSWNAFSPNTQDVGVVAVAAAPPIKPIDKRKPKVSRFVHTKGRFAFTVSERARIKWGVRKRVVHKVHRGKRSVTVVKLRQVRHGSLRAKKAGRVGFKYKRPLPAGTYRLSVRVTDLAGHTTRKTVGFKVHAKKHARIKG
jgi:tungstate transport system substrate-binding protein